MKTTHLLVISTAVLAFASVSAFAQETDTANILSVPQRCALYVRNKYFAETLALTPRQQADIQSAEMAHTLASDKLEADKNAGQRQWDTIDRKLADGFWSVLSPAQKQKAFQYGLPKIGISALADETMATIVGLNEIQLGKIQKIYAGHLKDTEDLAAMMAISFEAIPTPKNPDKAALAAREKKISAVFASYNGERQLLAHKGDLADKKALDLLTPAQKAKWHDLGGPQPKA